jgi:serine/threonine protein kinase, bacterial
VTQIYNDQLQPNNFIFMTEITKKELLAQYANGERDFRGIKLVNVNLSGVDLSEINFHGANLDWVDLSGANLSRSDLSNIRFSGSLSKAILEGANLNNTYLYQVDLVGQTLEVQHSRKLSYSVLD